MKALDLMYRLCYDSSSFSSEQIHNQQEWWQWLNNTVIPGLYPDVWYNGDDPYPVGYLGDTPTAWLLGVARLRQLRIQKSKAQTILMKCGWGGWGQLLFGCEQSEGATQ